MRGASALVAVSSASLGTLSSDWGELWPHPLPAALLYLFHYQIDGRLVTLALVQISNCSNTLQEIAAAADAEEIVLWSIICFCLILS